MKLGTSKPGTMAPALVAFLVLAGSAALAATQEPAPSPPSPGPAITRDQTGRFGHQSEEPEESVDATTPNVEVAGCGDALTDGDAALDRAHGLDRAIQAILERCGRGSTTQGLLNALEHLRQNKEKHEARGNPGKSGEDHGKPPGESGASDGSPGKSGEDHGSSGGKQDDGGSGTPSAPGGGNEVREGGGAPDDHGPGDR